MDRKYLKTNELGDLTPLCKLPETVLWRFCCEPEQYEVELFKDGKQIVVSGMHPQPHQAVSEALRQYRELPEEEQS